VNYGTKIATVSGTTIALLKAERVVLNFMQRMSGIATKTAEFVERVKDTKAKNSGYKKNLTRFKNP